VRGAEPGVRACEGLPVPGALPVWCSSYTQSGGSQTCKGDADRERTARRCARLADRAKAPACVGRSMSSCTRRGSHACELPGLAAMYEWRAQPVGALHVLTRAKFTENENGRLCVQPVEQGARRGRGADTA